MRLAIKAGLRLVLILVFLNATTVIVNALVNTSTSSRNSTIVLVDVIDFLVLGAILAVIWWKTDAVVGVLVGSADDSQLTINTSNTDLFKTVVRILGLVLLVTALPGLAGAVAYDLVQRTRNLADNPYL